MNAFRIIPFIILLLTFLSCSENEHTVDPSAPLFTLLSPLETGIQFRNDITENFENNLMRNEYMYSGGGVAVGDINNDGKQDIYFISNQQRDALYLNEGNFKFKDITASAGIKFQKGWNAGVTMVDINQDGFLDIYVCRGGEYEKNAALRTNLLYVNNGDMTFTESAAKYGLADAGSATMAGFFDYDLDGDLDCYVLNHPVRQFNISLDVLNQWKENPPAEQEGASDRLYRNNGDGTFSDVTREAGLMNFAYGLGIVFGDVNQDSYPDVFITNDFEVEDFYYENNGDGTFTNRLKESFGHASYFAMGVDMADFNNDGWLDIYEVEMLPENRKRAIVNMQSMNRKKFEFMTQSGLHYQYMRNSLHLNQGSPNAKNAVFSEIAQLAKVNKTDWSWGTLLIDLDDDGWKDIFVANGIAKDMKDRDYTMRGNQLARQVGGGLTLEQVHQLVPSTKVSNYAFKNEGDLTFEKSTKDWGLDKKGFSNGVSYADLDNDGDLELIINNLNEEPWIYKSNSREKGNNYLNIKLIGDKDNVNGLGTKITLYTSNGIQFQENHPVHGFQSSSEPLVHFGLKDLTSVDKIEVTWMNGKTEIRSNVTANQILTFKQADATTNATSNPIQSILFQDITSTSEVHFQHQEIWFDDYKTEILLPHKMSQNGPALAVTSLNKDEKAFYIGGASGQAGTLYFLKEGGKFTAASSITISTFEKDKTKEDLGACFFDADSDGDKDLYVVSGSNEFEEGSSEYQDRLYLNDGQNNFKKATNALPKITASGSCVVAGDFDKDGDEDLFVGGRVIPQKYPYPARSYILENEGGTFKDVTETIAPELVNRGLVTSAIWTDFDNDTNLDLMVTGEWMPLTVFKNEGGKFSEVTDNVGLANTEGWWWRIVEQDLDGDGDSDYVVGNIGLNHKFKASEAQPFNVFCSDFDSTGSLDIVLAQFQNDNELYPVRGRDCSSEQMPFITEKFPTFASFGDANLKNVYGEKLDQALHHSAKLFASVWLENDGSGKFTIHQLPVEAQLSAVMGIIAEDLDKDGKIDLLLAGNLYETEAETSRADANLGVFLKGNGQGSFSFSPISKSGFYAPGDVKDIKILEGTTGERVILVAKNNAAMQVFRTL